MFVDEAEIEVKAGDGGTGVVSLRREKHVPRGGPDGGSGGHGGDVIIAADPHLRTLVDFTRQHHYRAEDGGRGRPKRQRGKDGADAVIRLPVGTLVRDADARTVIADLVHPGQRVVVVHGGRGGRGNATFASAVQRTPRYAEKGEPGGTRRMTLELKLLADVGLLGLPNVGKSSLIARVSAARPKIAAYPFTTLVPNLGVVRIEEGVSFVIADLPGLVEGAHLGVGRGHGFLRHVERNRLLIHLLDVSLPERDPLDDFAALNRELALYRAELADRPQLVALNKIDLQPPPQKLAVVESSLEEQGCAVFRISAVTGEGVAALMGAAASRLAELPEPIAEEAPIEAPAGDASPDALRVERLGDGSYRVAGEVAERVVVMTNLENEEAVRHLHRRLQRMGVIRRLRSLGAKDGDRVCIGSIELEFVD